MRKPLIGVLLAAAGIAAQAQKPEDPASYPTRPIRFILISAAGSGGDTLGRLIADRMGTLMRATFVMENRPGAGGVLATDLAAKAKPDGYTVTMGGATTHVLVPASNPRIPYNAIKDFAPIGQIGTASILLVASNDLPANNLKELVELARKTRTGLDYASWGNGSTGHFCGELLNLKTKADLRHIPYKSVAQSLTDLMGNQIKLAFVDMASGTPMVKAGRMKAIATCTSPSPSLPGVRSYEEDGISFSGKRMGAFRWSMYAPAKTPKPIVDKLAAALKATVEMPDVKARLLELGISSAFVAGPQLSENTARDIEAWKQVAKEAGITND